MTRWIPSLWIRDLLRHPRRLEVLVGLVGLVAAASGFQLGRAQSTLDEERHRLTVLNRRVESGVTSLGDGASDAPLEGENILEDLLDGVDGVRTWVTGVRRAAKEAGFRLRLRWGDSGQPLPGRPEVEHVEVILELESAPTSPEATVQMDGVLEHLDMERPPFEISRIRWTGSGAGLRGVVVEGRLWIRNTEA
jgi:hypothetical protein